MSKDGKKTSKESKKKSTTANCPAKKSRIKAEDNIVKSKKLTEKLQSCRRNSNIKSSRITNRTNNDCTRVCDNGKPMPSLSELEKMFEDSDADEGPHIVTRKETNLHVSSSPLSSEKLTSPSTIKKIADKMMDMISNLPYPNSINGYPPTLPHKKRKKPEAPYIVRCEEHIQLPKRCSSSFCKDTYSVDKNENMDKEYPIKQMNKNEDVDISKSIFDSKSDDIPTWLKDCEKSDHSDGSTDSNKTIDYDVSKTTVSDRPHSFSPLPSTSRDRETINRNDQLFNKSLLSDTGANENQTKIDIINDTNTESDTVLKQQTSIDKQTLADKINHTNIDDDVEILQNPCETIVIDDDIEISKPIKKQMIDENDIIECIEIDESDDIKKIIKLTNESEAIVIDDDDCYKIIDVDDNPVCDEVTEVIDIDDIIAENKSIIAKYSKDTDQDINTVTYVDSTTISNLNSNEGTSLEPNSSNMSYDVEETNTVIINDASSTQNAPQDSLQEIVTDFFTTNTRNESHSESDIPRNSGEASVLQKFTDWLHMLSARNSVNSHNSLRNTIQNEPVIQVHDMLSQAVSPTYDIDHEHHTNSEHRHVFRDSPRCDLDHQHHTSSEHRHIFRDSLTCHKDHQHHTCSEHRHIYRDPPTCHKNHQHHTSSEHHRIFRDFNRRHVNRAGQSNQLNKRQQPNCNRTSPQVASTPKSPAKNFGDCPICMDSLGNNLVASTICGHVFCLKCIESAFRASGKKCPTCRKPLKKGGYHQLFL